MTSTQAISPSLFQLPLEIREIIYAYLTPASRLPTVIRSRRLGVSSVSHRPPPVNFLLTSRQAYAEALDVYYRRCTFKFDGLLDPANVLPLWQIEEVLGGTELGKATLSQIRKVELNLFWHRLPEGGVTRVALANIGGVYGTVCKSEVEKRAERLRRAIDILKLAQNLTTVIVTWKEIPVLNGEEQPDSDVKLKVLTEIGALRGVRVIPGDIVASETIETALVELIKEIDRSSSALEKIEHGELTNQPKEYLTLVERSGRYLSTPADHVTGKRSYFG